MSGSPENKNRRRAWHWLGFPIALAGVLSYFMVFARFPALRDFPWVNLPLTLFGLGMAIAAIRRVKPLKSKGKTFLAWFFAAASLGITALFLFYVFHYSYQLPQAEKVVLQGGLEFTLNDHNGLPVNLSDYRGRNVVLTFYRGYW